MIGAILGVVSAVLGCGGWATRVEIGDVTKIGGWQQRRLYL